MDNSNNQNSYLMGDSHTKVMGIYDYTNNVLTNPIVLIILVIVVVLYIVIFMSLGDNKSSNDISNSNYNIGSSIIIIFIIVIFIVLILINGLQYFFGLNIITSIKNMFTSEPEIDIAVSNTPTTMPSVIPEMKYTKQVFNIPGNNYIYSDAKALCNAYGADLANYKQVEDSYNSGAEWCNYGWSDGQMALFPTQQTTYDGLQKIPGHENDCGRPGINGGFMANPDLKFGVNCYGYKPKITEEEEELMQDIPVYPRTAKDILLENRVDYWKERLPDILVSPFNHKNWSKI